jgi:hypothetical protein
MNAYGVSFLKPYRAIIFVVFVAVVLLLYKPIINTFKPTGARTVVTIAFHSHSASKTIFRDICTAQNYNCVEYTADNAATIFAQAKAHGPVIIENTGDLDTMASIETVSFAPLIQRETVSSRARLSPLMLKPNMLNYSKNISVLYYNTKAISVLGLDIPDVNQTWDEFAKFMAKLVRMSDPIAKEAWAQTDNGINAALFATIIESEDVTEDNWYKKVGVQYTLQCLKAMADAGLNILPKRIGNITAFKTNMQLFKDGILPVAIYDIGMAEALDMNDDWLIAPLPLGKTGKRMLMVNSYTNLSLVANSNDIDLGWSTIKWLVIGGGAQYAQQHPTAINNFLHGEDIPDISAAWEKHGLRNVFESFKTAKAQPYFSIKMAVNNCAEHIYAYVEGKEEIKTTLQYIEEAALQSRMMLSEMENLAK